MFLQVISAVDGFTDVGVFLIFDGRFTVVLLLVVSCTLLAFVIGFFNQTFHRLLNLPHLISHGKHGFKLIVDYSIFATRCCWVYLKRKKKSSLITRITRANIKICRHAQVRKKKEAGLCETYRSFLLLQHS